MRPDPRWSFVYSGMQRILLGLTAIGLLAAPLGAQESIASDRPGIGSGATVIDAGVIQLEGGFSYSEDVTNQTYSIGQALVRYGVRGLEFDFFANSYVVTRTEALDDVVDGEGFEDLGVGVKVPLVKGVEDLRLSLQGILTTPSGSDIFTGDEWVPSVNLLADVAVSGRLGAR